MENSFWQTSQKVNILFEQLARYLDEVSRLVAIGPTLDNLGDLDGPD